MWKVFAGILCLILLIVSVDSLYFNRDKNTTPLPDNVEQNEVLALRLTLTQHNQGTTIGVADKPDWFNAQLKDRFDRFTAMFEQSENQMWQMFNQECKLLKDCPGLTELFSRYLEYKKSLVSIDGTSPTDIQSFSDRLDDLVMIREQFFSELEMEMLFAREQAWDEAALQRLQIKQDPNLSKAQKRTLLEAHIEALPEPLKKSLLPTLRLSKLASLRQQSPSQTSTYNEYAAEFGSEAAQRLVELQQQRASWKQKLSDYQSQVNTLSTHYSSTELTDKIQTLKDEMFSLNEQKRLAVISN